MNFNKQPLLRLILVLYVLYIYEQVTYTVTSCMSDQKNFENLMPLANSQSELSETRISLRKTRIGEATETELSRSNRATSP